MHRLPFWQVLYKHRFVQAPCLHHQPAHTVPVHRAAKFLFGYRKSCLHITPMLHHSFGGHQPVNELYGKNRKRFPCTEKRMNMLLTLEPLIYFESMTNGKRILKNDYFRRRSSDTVSLWRPFARREASTLRPLADSIRLRKPCTDLRLRREGWYVRFITYCFKYPFLQGSAKVGENLTRTKLYTGNQQKISAACLAVKNTL